MPEQHVGAFLFFRYRFHQIFVKNFFCDKQKGVPSGVVSRVMRQEADQQNQLQQHGVYFRQKRHSY